MEQAVPLLFVSLISGCSLFLILFAERVCDRLATFSEELGHGAFSILPLLPRMRPVNADAWRSKGAHVFVRAFGAVVLVQMIAGASR